MPRTLVIVDYDPAWVEMFEAEKTRILGVIGDKILAIEHIGSTSVPGLGAKPIIDILIGLRDLSDAALCIAPVESLGYDYITKFENIMPFRRYFRKVRSDGEHTHHIHMVAISHDFWTRHLLFRDYLRTHPDDAAAYEKVKRELASQFTGETVNDYADAKSEIINAIMEKARAWRGDASNMGRL